MNKQSLRKMVEEAIEEYNKYRSPEDTAKLVSMNGKFLRIEFLGTVLSHLWFLRLL